MGGHIREKFGARADSDVGLPKMMRAFCVMPQSSLDVQGLGFFKSGNPRPQVQNYRN